MPEGAGLVSKQDPRLEASAASQGRLPAVMSEEAEMVLRDTGLVSPTSSRRRLLQVSWAALAVGTLAACGVGGSKAAAVPTVVRTPGEVIFAPHPDLAIPTVTKNAAPLAKALSDASGLNVKVLAPSDASGAMLWLQQGKIDIAWLEPLFYVKAQNSLGSPLLLRTLVGGKPSMSGLILVRKDSGIKTLAGLKGKSVAATDPGDGAGWIFPAAAVKKAGVDPFNDMDVKFNAGSDDAVIALLSKDQQGQYGADAAFIDEAARGDKKIADKLKTTGDKVLAETVVLQKTDGAPTAVLVARRGLDSKTMDALRQAFLGLNANKDLLQPFGVDGFVAGKDADFDALRDRAKQIGIPLTMD